MKAEIIAQKGSYRLILQTERTTGVVPTYDPFDDVPVTTEERPLPDILILEQLTILTDALGQSTEVWEKLWEAEEDQSRIWDVFRLLVNQEPKAAS